MAANRIELALAVAGRPLSLDSLVDWGLARPGELWAVVDDGTHQGFLAEDAGAGRGHFVFSDDRRRFEVLSQATVEDFDALVACKPLVPDVLSAARRAAAERRFRPAGAM